MGAHLQNYQCCPIQEEKDSSFPAGAEEGGHWSGEGRALVPRVLTNLALLTEVNLALLTEDLLAVRFRFRSFSLGRMEISACNRLSE